MTVKQLIRKLGTRNGKIQVWGTIDDDGTGSIFITYPNGNTKEISINE
jgi:dUTPase